MWLSMKIQVKKDNDGTWCASYDGRLKTYGHTEYLAKKRLLERKEKEDEKESTSK